MDDYQYQSKPANKKTQWPNALGYKGSLELSGLAGRSSSAYGAGGGSSNNGSGANTGAPDQGNTGTVIPVGGVLPDGVFGDMIYHNGAGWAAFNKPSTDGVLSIVAGTPTWITASSNGSLIYYDSNLDSWLTIPAPTGPETHVLGFKDGGLEWLQTTDCGATGATGP